MKLATQLATLTLSALMLAPTAPARGPQGCAGRGGGGQRGDCLIRLLQDLPAEDLNSAEEADLTYLREEEKLARDVYLALGEQWGLPIFSNIAGAEQRHMDAMLTLLEKYELPDPVGENAPGEFANPDLQALYGDLVAQGSASLDDALTVGATIEDLDIEDIVEMRERTDNEDMTLAYQNLEKGSRNHMRSFYGQLQMRGVDYAPQYISQEYFDEIVSTPHERGLVDAEGNPMNCPYSNRGRLAGPFRNRR
jgi:hypothetical protein